MWRSGWLRRLWLWLIPRKCKQDWTSRLSVLLRPGPSDQPALSHRKSPLAKTPSPCFQLLESPEEKKQCLLNETISNLGSTGSSDGVAELEIVFALSTVEEVEQGAFESLSNYHQTGLGRYLPVTSSMAVRIQDKPSYLQGLGQLLASGQQPCLIKLGHVSR